MKQLGICMLLVGALGLGMAFAGEATFQLMKFIYSAICVAALTAGGIILILTDD